MLGFDMSVRQSYLNDCFAFPWRGKAMTLNNPINILRLFIISLVAIFQLTARGGCYGAFSQMEAATDKAFCTTKNCGITKSLYRVLVAPR